MIVIIAHQTYWDDEETSLKGHFVLVEKRRQPAIEQINTQMITALKGHPTFLQIPIKYILH